MTTSLILVVAVVLSWIAWAVAPATTLALYYSPRTMGLQVWRLVTWPLADQPSLFGIFILFLLWYCGTNLENAIGRSRMVWMLVGIWASLTISATIVGFTLGSTMLAGIFMIEFVILLVWVAEYPTMRFFFNIPAWAIGLIVVVLQVLQLLGTRDLQGLLSLALSLVLVAITARMVGLLTAYPWIPGGRRAGRAKAPRQTHAQRSEARARQRQMSDRDRLDMLLDQINEKGIHSLTPAQRREMLHLRDRLRGN